jgi:hypothetical protein
MPSGRSTAQRNQHAIAFFCNATSKTDADVSEKRVDTKLDRTGRTAKKADTKARSADKRNKRNEARAHPQVQSTGNDAGEKTCKMQANTRT